MRATLLLLFLLCLAPDAPVFADDRDIPSRIGRLDLVSGEVSFRLLNDSVWSEAGFNYPVCTGMTLSTDGKARAEINIGPNALQMSSDTLLEVTTLSNRLTDIALHRGHIHLSLHQIRTGETIQLELPNGSIWVLEAGRYEVDLSTGDTPTRIGVLDGKARFVAAGKDVDIATNQQAVLHEDETITVNDASKAVPSAFRAGTPVPADDGFINWAAGRDALPISEAPNNLARDTSGYETLDAYGEWQNSDTYGRVWFPGGLPADWQPYRFGHWVSVQPWGPTWIDDQPWGFVPFHYGRWAMIDGRWGWVPGNAEKRAVYAPALVAFIGSGDDALVIDDSGTPAVAWVPLAPDEPFEPWYPADQDYIESVNAGSVRDFHGLSRERLTEMRRTERIDGFGNGHFTTAVSRAAFASARPVAAAMLHATPERLGRAPMMAGAPRFGLTEGRRAAPDPATRMGEAHAPANAPLANHPAQMPAGARPEGPTRPAAAPGPGYHPITPAVRPTQVAQPRMTAPAFRPQPAPFRMPVPSRPAFVARAAPAPHISAASGGRHR